LSKPQLVKKLKKRFPNLNQSELSEVIEVFCTCLQEALSDGRKVELRNFGTFFTKKMKEKFSARNPATGELIYVPEKNKVRFRAGKKLKEFINK
jgi:integration host factor subunit beta